MGYTIRIGNAVVESHWPDGKSEYEDDPYTHWYVHSHHEDSAPHFEDSGQSNDRAPSYTAWADFADKVGLREFFFNKESGKMREHPGCQKLTQADAAMLTKKLAEYREANPESVANYCQCSSCNPWKKSEDAHNPKADATLVRLTWLEWWVRWAVANCERPAIYNS